MKEIIYGNFKNKVKDVVEKSNVDILNVDGFDIDVKFKNWERIKYLRELALLEKKIPVKSQEEVSGKIRYLGESYKVDISLTGGMLDHLKNPKQWSLAVKVKDDKTIFGMKKFALLIPDARGYMTDWITHKMLKSRGVIGLRSNFIDVNINGDYHGIYYVEERFDKRLIESNQLREGIVFKLNLAIPKDNVRQVRDVVNSHLNFKTELVPYGSSKISQNPELNSQLINLKKIWAAFETNSLPVEQVFDMRKFASLFAISDLLNEKHGMSIHNTRFYYNPITSLIEPIAREWLILNENKKFGTLFLEGEVYEENFYDNYYLRSEIYEKLYANLAFKKMYLQEAKAISRFSFLDNLIENNKEEIQSLVAKINKHNPKYIFPEKILRRNQKLLRDKLFPSTPSIRVFFDKKNKDSLSFLVENLTHLPNEITSVKVREKILSNQSVVIDARQDSENRLQRKSFKINTDINIKKITSDSITIYYNVLGFDNEVENYLGRKVHSKTVVFPKIMELKDYSELSLPNRKPNVQKFKFLKINEDNKTIRFKGSKIVLNDDLIIPQGYTLIGNAGLNIDIINRARIISYSPLRFLGKVNELITITSSDLTGQGIVVYNSVPESVMNYVSFENLSNISDTGWNLKGSITFYESPIFINNCFFNSNLKGDDYLNIVRTTFNIQNTIFKNTFADAVDTDFSKGEIINTSFFEIGNDAIDVSGTDLTLSQIKIFSSGDKGISGGEGSSLKCENIFISDSEIGVASKDDTKIEINNIEIMSSKLGYCAFQKKSEYGPGEMEIVNSKLSDVKTEHLIEMGSSLILNGATINKKSDKVKQYLYGVEYGKNSE
ncbi:CotH kinase family protein [Algibacter aquimarinus]|uniref:CotH kinase family protein n=1 Tax=Algibacter aquimarinus TaxID=1136748 RepID=UPI0031EA2581